MTHTEREWRDGQPEGTGLDEDAGRAGQVPGNDPLAERTHADDPLAERTLADDPLAERVHADDPLAERVDEDDPLVEDVHEPAGLASAGRHERFAARWQEIQAGFVDEPRRAVQDADALVVDMMDQLARMLAREREQLESLGATGNISTEDLRLGLRRYRALFERLLAV
ncbi:MAG TPA: hypothetical protein VEH31_25790 [Streptosporangiaceae bacterium]|nr:hypothetical protein [Streptosporangiaceae bacterium]